MRIKWHGYCAVPCHAVVYLYFFRYFSPFYGEIMCEMIEIYIYRYESAIAWSVHRFHLTSQLSMHRRVFFFHLDIKTPITIRFDK